MTACDVLWRACHDNMHLSRMSPGLVSSSDNISCDHNILLFVLLHSGNWYPHAHDTDMPRWCWHWQPDPAQNRARVLDASLTQNFHPTSTLTSTARVVWIFNCGVSALTLHRAEENLTNGLKPKPWATLLFTLSASFDVRKWRCHLSLIKDFFKTQTNLSSHYFQQHARWSCNLNLWTVEIPKCSKK